MAAAPHWLARLAQGLGIQKPGDLPASQQATSQQAARPVVVPGTVVLKPKGAPKPSGREITLQPKGLGHQVGAPLRPQGAARPHIKQLTPAAMVYALAAGILLTLAVYNLFHGSLFNGIVTLVPAGGLAVLAYKYIQ